MKALALILFVSVLTLRSAEPTQNKLQNFVPAKIVNGQLIPVINLPVVDITANPQVEVTGYTLPIVTITAPKQNSNMLPAVKWNGDYIATTQLAQVDVTAKKKKTMLASFFSFEWLSRK